MITDKTRTAIITLQKSYPEKRSALLPALHMVQDEIGYLPLEAQSEVAELFDITTSEVHAVVTFYDMFFEAPKGKHLIHVCKNISCMLRGADGLLNTLCHKLKVSCGETTEDGEFTIVGSECLAACDRAPMLLIDEEVIGPIQDGALDQVLTEILLKVREGVNKNG
ncbi:MAG: NADH-quinone oxidoreductase subunit NuoE [Parachlamydiaceae bacterium]|nr:NADH-quinone oxidoreductase subunit NuoE [Parachlamydiaceae bacterium]